MKCISSGKVSLSLAKQILKIMWETKDSPEKIIKEKGFGQISDEKTLRHSIQNILTKHSKQVKEYKQGKQKLFGFFIGKVMQLTGGQANPQMLKTLLKEELEK